jgi:outer membrane murein-binding lipoprotein Lpp
MKRKLLLPIITIVLLFSLAMAGCQAGGIPQAQYDQLNAQLADVQAKLAQAQNDLNKLQADKSAADKQFQDAQATIAGLQDQLKSQAQENSLVGATPAETAAKIVKYYHETHVYTTYDLFICADMAAEVWNMLKAQGINSVIAVGDVEKPITDIIQSTHGWVLAEVATGQYLALETTGGYVVHKSEHPLYYAGWTFDSPANLKSYTQMIREYNIRVAVRNEINHEVNAAGELLNNAASQAEADKYQAVYDKLVELRGAQEAELNSLMAEIQKLARPLL